MIASLVPKGLDLSDGDGGPIIINIVGDDTNTPTCYEENMTIADQPGHGRALDAVAAQGPLPDLAELSA